MSHSRVLGWNISPSQRACLLFLGCLALAQANNPSWYNPPSDWEPEPTSQQTIETTSSSISSGSTNEETGHKDLFPLDASDYFGFICATLGLILASGGGIGGGGMLVPIYVLVMGFSPKHAIPLSNVTVFGGSISNFILNRIKRHPEANRPLIDMDLILVMQPMTLAGALLGSFANKLLPEIILTICLVLLLGYTTKQTLEKGMVVYAKETKDKEKKESELSRIARASGSESAEKEGLLDDSDLESERQTSLPQRELSDIYEEESTVPWWKLQLLWAIFAVVIAVNILKGGGGFESPVGITCGSNGYWLSTAVMFFSILAVSAYVRSYLVEMSAKKKRLAYKYVTGDIAWDESATVVYPLICIGAGLCAGLFGIGGGIVQVPLMLHLGVQPKVASASSATMILYTSATALTSFYVFGLLVMDYALPCLVIGTLVTAVGQVGTNELIKRLGRDSIIIFSVAAVVGVSAVLMGTHSAVSLASSEVNLEIGSFCADGER
jgi:uncharacterized membrane protein YfcA